MVAGGTFRFGEPHSSSIPADLEISSGLRSFQPADRHTTENVGADRLPGTLAELTGRPDR